MRNKKIFLLLLIIPVLYFFVSFLSYKNNPVVCGNDFKTVLKCESYLEYLTSVTGFISAIVAITSFVLLSLAISGIFFILNGRKKTGYLFLALLILSLFWLFYRFKFILGL